MTQNDKKLFIKNKKLTLILIIAFFIIAIFFCIKIYKNNEKYIIKIDNKKIYKEEFILYLYNQKEHFENIGGTDIWETPFYPMSAKDVAKNNAINSIIILKTASNQAKNLGIKLTKEEKYEIKEKAIKLQQKVLKFYPEYNIKIKDCEKYIKENMLESKIFTYITEGYQINEKDFERFFKENMIKKPEQNYNKYILDYIKVEKSDNYNSEDIINEIFNEIEINTDFNNYSKKENVTVKTNITLENDIFETYVYDIIYKLNKGSTSSIIETAENFYIFKIKDIEKFSEEEIRQIKKEEYILMKKNEIYSSQIEAWTKNMVIEKNDNMLNNIDIEG